MLNELWHCDCVEGLQRIATEIIPLTVTSCPWDNMYHYGGHVWDYATFQCVADELWRVTAPGGIVAWDIADAIVNGALTGTTARQTCYFLDIGFRLHEKIVVHKNSSLLPALTRHGLPPEEVLVFSKGKAKTVHRRRKPNKPENVGRRVGGSARRYDGSPSHTPGSIVKAMGYRGSIWSYCPCCPRCGFKWDGSASFTTHPCFDEASSIKPYSNWQRPGDITGLHPARMSPPLVQDLILAYSNPGDLVLDCFAGSGTTLRMALLNHRFYLGMEIFAEYVKVASINLDRAKKAHFGLEAA